MVLRSAACVPTPTVVMSPLCDVGAIWMFGVGWSSPYQTKTATVPAL